MSRIVAVQCIYCICIRQDVLGDPDFKEVKLMASDLADNHNGTLSDKEDLSELDRGFYNTLINGIYDTEQDIDEVISLHLSKGWRIERLPLVVLAILRLALYEMLHLRQLNKAAIINEYLEMARLYNHDDELSFINGLLDKVE